MRWDEMRVMVRQGVSGLVEMWCNRMVWCGVGQGGCDLAGLVDGSLLELLTDVTSLGGRVRPEASVGGGEGGREVG